eukprot:GHVS01083410.1.p1 GENE.GHVS01083410.1~~GHVS01083410.1.p1  ORF type:complete len:158 (+),score=11.55 GHVS01083410.1:166-639(+)
MTKSTSYGYIMVVVQLLVHAVRTHDLFYVFIRSGNLLCEYTDYKCNFDHPVNSQALQTSSTPLLLPRDYPHDYVSSRIGVAAAGTLSWGRLHAADMVNLTMQYTAAHMTLLGDKEDCLRTLYRCHRMGTLAASMAFHSLSSDDGSVVSSETSDEHNG